MHPFHQSAAHIQQCLPREGETDIYLPTQCGVCLQPFLQFFHANELKLGHSYADRCHPGPGRGLGGKKLIFLPTLITFVFQAALLTFVFYLPEIHSTVFHVPMVGLKIGDSQ